MAQGTLYIVATPIGNLEDLTYRAARILGEVDAIACEDTRHSRTLLEHYGIRKPLISYYREREAERAAAIVARLEAGETIALITDAGAPVLSDPGARLVAAASAAGVGVVPVPGASALTAALMTSGLGADAEAPLVFLGFLPARSGARRRRLEDYRSWGGQIVFFETPHRLVAALEEMQEIWGGERTLMVARELTKAYEEIVRGTVATAWAHFQAHAPKGEFTLIAGPAVAADGEAREEPPDDAGERKRWARQMGLSRSEAYRRWQARYTSKG